MTTPAELSSIASGLEELTRRITSIAESLDKEDRESLGPDLYEVERTLDAARRRMARLVTGGRR